MWSDSRAALHTPQVETNALDLRKARNLSLRGKHYAPLSMTQEGMFFYLNDARKVRATRHRF